MENKIQEQKFLVAYENYNYDVHCNFIYYDIKNNRLEFRNFNPDIIEGCVFLTDVPLDYLNVSYVIASFPYDKTGFIKVI